MAEQQKRYNRLKVSAEISPMMSRFYEDIRNAPSQGRKVAWLVGAAPYDMFNAMNIANFQTENHAARISADQKHMDYIDVAENAGWPTDTCSYTRVSVGAALLMMGGQEDRIPERHSAPKPDFVYATNTCPAMIQWCDSLRRIFDVPMFQIDCAYTYDEKDYLKNVEYAKSQLEDLVIFIENMTGKPYNWDGLRDIIFRRMQKMAAAREEVFELCKRKPAPISAFDAMITMGPGNTVRSEESLEFYEKLLEEVKDRIKNEIACLPNEKYRLMWRANFPWYAVGKLSRMMAQMDVCLATGHYGFEYYGHRQREVFPPLGFDESDLLRTIASEQATRNYTRTLEWKIKEEIETYINGFEIDGIVLHSPASCRPWCMGELDMARLIESRYGIPTLIIESDHTDPRYFNEASVKLKLQALIERIAANKKT